ncbi:unnamed protein product, partial [Brachionus calyciflorus]
MSYASCTVKDSDLIINRFLLLELKIKNLAYLEKLIFLIANIEPATIDNFEPPIIDIIRRLSNENPITILQKLQVNLPDCAATRELKNTA